jgi:simple sugar transport system permease protein
VSPDVAASIFMTVVMAATPILIAALGELVVEKSGVLNLGVEGMMLCGAVSGFAIASTSGITALGYCAGAAAGALLSMVFALLVLSLAANQVATGLALTIFGAGVSSLTGRPFVGTTVARLGPLMPHDLAAHPVLRAIFGYDAIVYLSLALTALIAWFLSASRAGLILRAVGEGDVAAHAIGHPVLGVRAAAIIFGGASAGLAGAYYSLAVTPMWADRLTAGRGWIALALVVFAAWRPWRLLAGAYLFGAVMTLELQTKASGLSFVPPEFLAMLPYLATVLVLALIGLRAAGGRPLQAPACLGKPFRAG